MYLSDAVPVDVPCGAGLSGEDPDGNDMLGGWFSKVLSVAAPIVGIVAAPFTGGASLALTAAAKVYQERQQQLAQQRAVAAAGQQQKAAQAAQAQVNAAAQASLNALMAQTRVTPSTGVAPFAPQAIAPFIPPTSPTTYASGYVPPPVGVALPGYTPGTTPAFAPFIPTGPYTAASTVYPTNYTNPLPPGYPVPPGYPGYAPQSRAPGVMAATAGLGMGNLPPWALPVMAAVGIILILTKGPPPPERAPDVH